VAAETVPHCANHPTVETYVSCSNCGKPICPDCMVQAPVGIKCRECARLPRSARVRLKPGRAAAAVAVALGLGLVVGFAISLLQGVGFGFFSFILAWFAGQGIGEAVKRASGYYRGTETGVIAAAGALLAFVSAPFIFTVLHGGTIHAVYLGPQVLFGAVAAFVAYRHVS
jgi:hypothetical protein